MRFMTNIQIICKLQPNFLKPQGVMKNLIYILFLTLVMTGCHDEDYQDYNLIPDLIFNINVPLTNEQQQDLILTAFKPVVFFELGHRGIIVYNTGVESIDKYLAFDLACPHVELQSCVSPMDYSVFPELRNSCAEDNIFYNFELGYSRAYSKDENGDEIPVDGERYELQQYKVIQTGPEELRISNY